MWLPSRGVTWAALALGVVLVGAGTAALLLERKAAVVEDGFTASELVTLRFPDDWENLPIRRPEALLAMPKPVAPQPEGPTEPLTRMSSADFAGALAALDARLAALRKPQPPNAMFNDAQIASLKSRLGLTPQQEERWPPMEEALRNMAWKQTNGRNGPVVDPDAAKRLKDAADDFLAVLTERQKRDIRLLANIGGLKLDL
jgi:hypothetical protein